MPGKKLEVAPAEARLSLGIVESVWLVEQGAVAMMKPGARRWSLAEEELS